MMNVNYNNCDVKRDFKRLLFDNPVLYDILDWLKEKYEVITIMEIMNNNPINIIINCDNEKIIIDIDINNKQTMISNSLWQYQILFSNIGQKGSCFIGKKYSNKDKSVLMRNVIKNPLFASIHVYELRINDQVYNITINEFGKKTNDIVIINALLNSDFEVKRIIDILKIIGNVIDISDYEIKVSNQDTGDVIITYKGEITKYIEYHENDDIKEKIYLENGEFFIEKTKKMKLDDMEREYIKKIGVKR